MAQDVCPLISGDDRLRLEAIVADRNRAQKHVLRARIVLHSVDRLSVAEVARRTGVGRPAVWRWQRRSALAQLGARHLTTRPYRPRTNGKAERFIQTALREWLYGKPYPAPLNEPPTCPRGCIGTTTIDPTPASTLQLLHID